MTSTLPNGADNAAPPIELAFSLPQSPQVRIHVQLTILKNSLLVFLTTTSPESPPTSCVLGSFVYAMPNVRSEGKLFISLGAH